MLPMNDPVAVPMTTQHALNVFEMRRDPRNTGHMTGDEFAAMLEQYQAAGPAYAIECGGLTAAVFGAYVLRSHVAEVWLVPTALIEKYPVAFCDAVRIKLVEAIETHALHRVQIAVRADDARALRFADWLGFIDEGPLHKYGSDGADYRRLYR